MKTSSLIHITVSILTLVLQVTGQDQPYGSKEQAGKYLDVGDANIYYEVYGAGKPILPLHGGMFVYIDEYSTYIPILSKNYKVIAIATRGHSKSELGTKPLSYELFAEDASKVLQEESNESASLIGFSDGAIISLVFGAKYPELTNKIVSLAGGFGSTWFHQEALNSMKEITGEGLQEKYSEFVTYRKKFMPEPDRWDEFIEKLNQVNMQSVYITDEEAKSITSPVLIVGGDKDDYFRAEGFEHMHQTLPNSQLKILPGYNHLDIITKELVFKETVLPFLTD
ncbi:MAG: alpha/beta fold hydrolase [Cyclobacteriaceae bacterium]